jgi:hypothetical protein
MSAFGGKADMDLMCVESAFDPKRTLAALDAGREIFYVSQAFLWAKWYRPVSTPIAGFEMSSGRICARYLSGRDLVTSAVQCSTASLA